ncbi:hypothetical protein AB6A40_006051 [Gnathostoma spinigerum]|uniref:RRM domain-containing protein n=1 Tax=Gnathostoma spinigerum TaxID=75299 RepID=A0ABD6ES12_9BILA
MSRIIVKGLPPQCTEKKLRGVLKKYGTITDCTLKYTADGRFRRFAFVGFDNDKSARNALDQLNGTFMGSYRITVDECRPIGDEGKPRAWSKYSKDSSAYKRLHGETEEISFPESRAEALTKGKGITSDSSSRSHSQAHDEKFEEFVSLYRSKIATNQKNPPASPANDELITELLQDISGDTSLSLIVRGLPAKVKKKTVKDWFHPLHVKGVKLSRGSDSSAAFISFNRAADVKKAVAKNNQFLGGYKVNVTPVQSKEVSGKSMDIHPTTSANQKEAERDNEFTRNTVLETGRLFVRNLPYVCTEDDLQFLFKKFGEVADIEFIIDKKTNRCKGFALITYVFPENALKALAALDGTVFKGRMLHIMAGEEKRIKEPTVEDGGVKSAFQRDKQAKLKSNAGKAHSWNALFLGVNAVADSLVAKLDIEKRDLLNGEGDISTGVRMALAETQLVRETREFLLSNGVCIDAFSRPASERSKTTIIVKNLPAGVEVSELQRMFQEHGEVKRAVMPSGGISALIEMSTPVDAKRAFNALAYSRFRMQPLYLEWAPINVFNKPSEENNVAKNEADVASDNMDSISEKKKRKGGKNSQQGESEENGETSMRTATEKSDKDSFDRNGVHSEAGTSSSKEGERSGTESKEEVMQTDEEEEQEGATIFVKNLNFQTTDEALQEVFENKYRVRRATVSRKRDPKAPTGLSSMGFGFVEFFTAKDAQSAIKTMQGTLLEGHSLELKISQRAVARDNHRKRKLVGRMEQGDSTKILIRNIPFQATVKEVKQLFSTFGEIRSLRLPKKIGEGGAHRGFGFVEFISRADARRAFDSLVHSTHLYGRRIVLEWAKEEESIEELREKAAASLESGGESRLQKKKMRIIEEDLTRIDDD